MLTVIFDAYENGWVRGWESSGEMCGEPYLAMKVGHVNPLMVRKTLSQPTSYLVGCDQKKALWTSINAV